MDEFEIGREYVLDFPYISETKGEHYFGEYVEHVNIKPGIRYWQESIGDGGCECDYIGNRILKPLAICEMPGGFKKRVIFHQKWVNPSGVESKWRVQMCTVDAFKKMLKNKHDYEIITSEEYGENND